MTETKVVLATLAREYEWDCDAGTEMVAMVGKVPANGLPLTLRRLPAAAAAS